MTTEEQEKIEIQNTIDEDGLQIIDVTEDNYLPPYSYTIGLYQQFNHPEIICFGLPMEVLQSFLTIAKDRIEEGEIFESGKLYTGFLEKNIKVSFVQVDKTFYKDYVGYADWFYDSVDFPVLQLVWPDKRGVFPWQDKFDSKLEFNQPLLDRNLDFYFYESRNLGVFTSPNVLKGEAIKYVIHDEEGDWFFLENDQVDNDEIQMASLDQVVKLDPSINSIYYLQYGWEARRNSLGSDWEEEESEWDEDDETEE